MAKKISLRWVAHSELSAAHAAFVVATGAPCTDAKTEQQLVGPVTEINNRLLSASLDMGVFWEQYLKEIARDSEMGQACTIALLWSGCNEMQVEQTSKAITSRMSESRLAFMHRFPKLSDQLKLRAKPLKEKWDTVGPGLLREVGKLVWGEPPSDWWPSPMHALMVQPMRGGDGGYDSENQRLWMEAVLADIDPRIPEVVRLTWLATRIAIDRYVREKSGDQSMAMPWALVSVPLALSAASELDVVQGDDLICEAMELWQFGDPRVAAKLSNWWSDFRQGDLPLPAALRVLDQQLDPADHASLE